MTLLEEFCGLAHDLMFLRDDCFKSYALLQDLETAVEKLEAM